MQYPRCDYPLGAWGRGWLKPLNLLWLSKGSIVTDVSWIVYVGFIAFVIAMLLVDLKLFHAEEHEPNFNESLAWFFVWFGLGVLFGLGLWVLYDGQVAGEYFAGFLIEKSLSVDNLFVFVLIFSYFQVPFAYQHQVLFYGILGALVFRGIFIAAGVGLINAFDWVVYVFGAFLILTAIRIAFGSEEVHPENNPVLKFAQKHMATTTRYDGQKLFTIENGHRVATPLFITLIFIEVTDIIFAVDSIPAILAITTDPFIVLTSNVFAILGLRALYFLLAGSVDRFHLLRYGLAVILAFVGVKMLLEVFHVEFPIALSLSFIMVVLAVTVYLSFKIPPPDKRKGVATFPMKPPPEGPREAEEGDEAEEPEAGTG
jgi:tellurite resistance protein TerC